MSELTVIAQVTATVASAVLLWLGYRTETNHEKPAARSFAALFGILGLTALCTGVTAHTGTGYKLVWLYTGLAIPLAMAFFAFDYYGIDFFAVRSRTAGALTPAVAGALGGTVVVLGTPTMSPGTVPPVTSLTMAPAVVLDLAATLNQVGLYYTTAVMILAVALVVRTVYRYEHLDARLGPVILFVGVWPWLANLFVPQLTAAFSFDIGIAAVAAGYTVSAVVAALATGPFRLLESSPMAGTVGPDAVLDSMDDAVVFVDESGRVLRLNSVACETFGTTETEAAGGPLEGVVGHSTDEITGAETISAETVDGVRAFEVTRSAVTGRDDAERGYSIVLRDVTRRRTREQRLDVFNRILRHNLRNDATTIIGHAQLVADGGEPERSADQIVETTRELVDVAERARELDRMMTVTDRDGETAVGEVVETVAEEVANAAPAVELTTAVPDGATAAVPSSVFEVVVRNLVENAAEHNDADEPFVVVSVDHDEDGALAVAVADNGPGIPEHERAVVEAGTEDQLQHGSGIGLWATQWGVTQMGGDIAFSENDPRGSVVTVTVPAVDETAGASQSR